MSQKEKLIKRLKSQPKDFTVDELEQLLKYFGYKKSNSGTTSGSRLRFTKENGKTIFLHRPHPGNILKAYAIKQVIEILDREEQF